MIKMLLVLGSLLIVAVIVVLLARLFQHRRNVQRDDENEQWYQQRLQELQDDLHHQRIDQQEYQWAQAELDKTFVNDTRDIEEQVDWRPAKPWALVVALVVIAGGFYAVFGSWHYQQQQQQALEQLPELGKKVLQQQQQVDVETLQTFAKGLRQQLQQKGDDPVAWWIYAGLMTDLEQYDQANTAFERSLKLDPKRVGTLISYARFLLQTRADGNLQEAGQLLARALQQEPQNIDAISLSGFVAFEGGDYDQAINAWQQLLQQVPEDSRRRTAVKQAIADAKQRQQSNQQQLTVTVSIRPELASQVPDDATLFVYVTAVEGAPMPAAVKRVPAKGLPVTVTLSNADSMLGDYRLSDLQRWKVQARVSSDDKIDSQPGDLNAEAVIINAKQSAQAELLLNQSVGADPQ